MPASNPKWKTKIDKDKVGASGASLRSAPSAPGSQKGGLRRIKGRLGGFASLGALGARRGATAAQVALAWVLRHPDVIAIPKAVRADHLRENLAAAEIELTAEELAEIDRAFPPPARKRRLAMS